MNEKVAEAHALIEKEKQDAVDKCAAEISKVLEKYNCVFDFSVTITAGGQIIPNFNVVNKQ